MKAEDRYKLQLELKFLDEEKKRIQNLISPLPQLEIRRKEVILKLNPHHNTRA